MKFDKNFIIPIILSIISGILMIIIQKLPVSLVLGMLLFIVIPVLLIQKKTNNNWGVMFIFSLIITALFITIWISIMNIAIHYEWLEKIFLWPSSI